MPLSENEALQRYKSVGLVAAGALFAVSLGLWPWVSEPESLQANVAGLAKGGESAKAAALTRAAAVWALVAGFANIHHIIRSGSGAAWARLGWYGIVLGGAGLTTAYGLYFGAVEAAVIGDPDVSSFGPDIALALALAARTVLDLSFIAFWLALGIIAVGMSQSEFYPKLSWQSLLALGIAGVALSLIRLFSGTNAALEVLFVVQLACTSAWAMVMGLLHARRAW